MSKYQLVDYFIDILLSRNGWRETHKTSMWINKLNTSKSLYKTCVTIHLVVA